MKNIIFIPYIKRETNFTEASVGHANRHQGYEYGINSWKAWAENNGHEVYVMSDLLCPESQMLITWQRWQVLNILEHNDIEYISPMSFMSYEVEYDQVDNLMKIWKDILSTNLNITTGNIYKLVASDAYNL